MRSGKNIEKLITHSNINTSDKRDQAVLADLLNTLDESQRKPSALPEPNIWRTVMNNRMTKLASAVAVLMAIGVGFVALVQNGAQVAYGLEQTIEAYYSVSFLHIKSFKEGEDEPKEFWVEMDDNGQVRNARVHIPAWDSPADGAKRIVWHDNKAQIRFVRKNVLLTIKDKTVATKVREMIKQFNPALLVDRLYEEESQGKVEIEIDQPTSKTEPIVVTATFLPDRNVRRVLFVDQATMLVSTIEHYSLVDDEYQYQSEMEFHDYNQPIEAEMFTLESDDQTLMVDQATQDIGLAQGDLSDSEIAKKVVREFFEAWMANDYDKAGILMSGVSASMLEERMGNMNIVRIISMGEPVPHAQTGSLRVPCKIELERDGQTQILEPQGPFVRQVDGDPERWTIIGGI